MKKIYLIVLLLIAISGFGQTMPPQVYVKNKQWHNVKDYGVKGDSVTNDQTAINALLADSTKKIFYFPPGIYVCNPSNAFSNRTFIFANNAIIDGVAHIAVGVGPNLYADSTSIRWVENTRIIGELVSTVRIGTYYCKGLHADKFRITDTNSTLYPNQVIETGTKGVHFYYGTQNVWVDEIHIESNTKAIYCLGIDNDTILNTDHYPSNINIGKLTIDQNDLSGIRIANGKGIRFGDVAINDFDSLNAIHLYGCRDIAFNGQLKISGSNTVKDGLHGFYATYDTSLFIDDIRVDSATGTGILLDGTYNSWIKRAYCLNNDDYGLHINTGSGQTVEYIEAGYSVQGLRMTTWTNVAILEAYLHNNTTGFATATNNGPFKYERFRYASNSANYTTAPTLLPDVSGPLPSATNSAASVTVVGVGGYDEDSLATDTTGGAVQIFGLSGTANTGGTVFFGNEIGGVKRYIYGIKSLLYSSADSGRGHLGFYTRRVGTDEKLSLAMMIDYWGRVTINKYDTLSFYRFDVAGRGHFDSALTLGAVTYPATNGTPGYQLTSQTGGVATWEAAAGTGSGTADSTYINDGSTQYGPFLNDMFKIKEGTGINITRDDSTTYDVFKIASTVVNWKWTDSAGEPPFHVDSANYATLTDSAKKMDTTAANFTTYVTNHAGSGAGTADFDTTNNKDSVVLTGRTGGGNPKIYLTVKNINAGFDTTRITSGENNRMQIATPSDTTYIAGLINADSMTIAGQRIIADSSIVSEGELDDSLSNLLPIASLDAIIDTSDARYADSAALADSAKKIDTSSIGLTALNKAKDSVAAWDNRGYPVGAIIDTITTIEIDSGIVPKVSACVVADSAKKIDTSSIGLTALVKAKDSVAVWDNGAYPIPTTYATKTNINDSIRNDTIVFIATRNLVKDSAAAVHSKIRDTAQVVGVNIDTTGTKIAAALGNRLAKTGGDVDSIKVDTLIVDDKFTIGAKKLTGNQHFRATISSPNAVFTKDAEVCLVVSTEAALTITSYVVTCDADPTTEIQYSLKWADAFIGFGNAAVIDDTSTVAGVTAVTGNMGDPTIPAGKCIYLLFESTPDAATTQMAIDITYNIDP